MPLSMMNMGEKARVASIHGSDAVKRRLGSLGFVPGAIVSVVQVMGGSMILGLQDSRIAINDDLARRVMVQAA